MKLSVESRREFRDKIRRGEIEHPRIQLDPYDGAGIVSKTATIGQAGANKYLGKTSDLAKNFSKLGTIASVGSTIIDILETGDVEKELAGFAGSALTSAVVIAALGAAAVNPLVVGALAIGLSMAAEESVEAAVDWLRKSDAAKIEDIESVIDWVKNKANGQDDPNFIPPEELPQGGAPAATGSSRPLGRRGSIKAGDEYNALDALAEENAQSGGSLFRDAINKHLEQQKQQEQETAPDTEREISESARQQREKAPHASGESQQDSTGRRSRGPYDLDGPEAAAQEAPAAEVKSGSNNISDARKTETPLHQGARHYVEIGAEEGLELGANLGAEVDDADQPLSYYDTQYGPHGNRARAYIHFMEEKERAQQAEENQRRAAERAERARRNIPRQVPVNATGQVWDYPNRDTMEASPRPYYPGGGQDHSRPVPLPHQPGIEPGYAIKQNDLRALKANIAVKKYKLI